MKTVLRELVVYTPAIYSFSFCISTGPSAPTKFSGKFLSDKEILITWEEPVNANGIIRSYYIRVYDTKCGREAYNKTVPKEDNNEQRLSNLKPYTNFTFTIQAKTIELGEMAYFTAKTLEGRKFELFCPYPCTCPFKAIFLDIRAIFYGHGERPMYYSL